MGIEKIMIKEKYVLNNGIEIPKIGFGTLMLPEDRVVQLIKDAIDADYRLIDTAVDRVRELSRNII